ncbi:hypothetical protein GCM10022261_16430 [Brevibacterium daeguense]|uniref:Uncharacterized protein n=1 Tax=Brevibacterium daeguense TaxID=909936 RepID=A0ABP8EJK1_9MICO|nr:hypothetical protein [Brevibacterium daeguense]
MNEDKGSPDDHGKFSLSEDWIATGIGLILLTVCLLGLVNPEIIP